MDVKEIITDEELKVAMANANFGDIDVRDILKYGVLKCACGLKQGHTSGQILKELGLITKKYEVSKKGRLYLWEAFVPEKQWFP